jgi:hypothetical protein
MLSFVQTLHISVEHYLLPSFNSRVFFWGPLQAPCYGHSAFSTFAEKEKKADVFPFARLHTHTRPPPPLPTHPNSPPHTHTFTAYFHKGGIICFIGRKMFRQCYLAPSGCCILFVSVFITHINSHFVKPMNRTFRFKSHISGSPVLKYYVPETSTWVSH